MSTFPEPMRHPEGRKHLISLMLKLPIDIELDLLGMSIPGDREINNQELISQTQDFRGMVEIKEVGQTDCCSNAQGLSNQQLERIEPSSQVFYTFTQPQYPQDNTENSEVSTAIERPYTSSPDEGFAALQFVTPTPGSYQWDVEASGATREATELREIYQASASPKTSSSAQNKRKGNILGFLDSFNDGLAFSVNTIGAILHLGKLANYSRE